MSNQTEPEEPITRRQALAMWAAACDYIADEAPDVLTWRQAAALARAELAEMRGPCAPWVPYSPAHSPRRRKNGA